MINIYDINKTVDNANISLITNPEWVAISISIISLFFAFYSLRESKKSNIISKHPMQLEIYDAFNRLVIYTQIDGINLKHHEVAKFYEYYKKSKFYFSKELYSQLEDYFNICVKLADLSRKHFRDIKNNEKIKEIEEKQDKLSDEMIVLEKVIIKNLESVLKI